MSTELSRTKGKKENQTIYKIVKDHVTKTKGFKNSDGQEDELRKEIPHIMEELVNKNACFRWLWHVLEVLFGFKERSFFERIKRLVVIAYHIAVSFAGMFVFIFRIVKGEDAYGLQFYEDGVFYVGIGLFLAILIGLAVILATGHRDRKDYVIRIVCTITLFLSIVAINYAHYQTNMGILDPVLSFLQVPVIVSLFAFDAAWVKVVWIVVYVLDVFIAIIINIVWHERYKKWFVIQNNVFNTTCTEQVDIETNSTYYEVANEIDPIEFVSFSLFDLVFGYFYVFCPIILTFFLFFVRINPEKKKAEVELKKIAPIKENLDVILAEHQHSIRLKHKHKRSDGSQVPDIKIDKEAMEIEYKDLDILKKIGEGGSSNPIFKCRWNGIIVAYKIFAMNAFENENQWLESLWNTVNMLTSNLISRNREKRAFSSNIMNVRDFIAYVVMSGNFEPYGDKSTVNIEFKVATSGGDFRPSLDIPLLQGGRNEWLRNMIEICWDHSDKVRYSADQALEIIEKNMENIEDPLKGDLTPEDVPDPKEGVEGEEDGKEEGGEEGGEKKEEEEEKGEGEGEEKKEGEEEEEDDEEEKMKKIEELEKQIEEFERKIQERRDEIKSLQ